METNLDPQIAFKLDQLPNTPGVYLMKDKAGETIYIGKAVSLRSRVRSYFNASLQNHLANQVLRSRAKDIEWISTASEMEALILEANLVRKHSPRYNINLKDDKHFPYIRVTLSEDFPRFLITRRVTSKSKDVFFGPYTNSRAMRNTIKLMQKLFRIRDCDLKLPPAEAIRPCLSHHINRCDAPCAFLIEKDAYRLLVNEALLLLKGKHRELLDKLKAQMAEASKQLRFEEAGRIRDQLHNLETTLERQRVDLGTEDQAKDILAVARIGKTACVMLLMVRDGFVTDRKHFQVQCPLEQEEAEIITNFAEDFYRNAGEVPREILLSHSSGEDEKLEAILRELRGSPCSLEVPQRGEKRRQVHLATENAKMMVAEFVARKEKKNRLDYRVMALQEDLNMEHPPKRIEGFDISHLSGTNTVASQVVFIDGKPAKKEYRHYNVKTVQGIDDFASMHEILSRRVRRLLDEKREFPDLILIDGGKGQLGAAVEALRSQGVDTQKIIGLAKRLEEIFLPGISDPILLPKSSPSLQLLQQVRDESHRFAITFQRSKRKITLTQSWLDEVEGIGPKIKAKLLQHFKSPSEIEEAAIDELVIIAGVKLATAIRSYLDAKPQVL